MAAYNAEVDRFAAAVAGADPASVVEYFAMVLGNSVYPDDFPQHFRLAYLPKQRHLLIEYHLPPVEVIPVVKEYRYDRVRDDLTAIPRDEGEIRRRYIEIIAQVTLRTIHEIDRGGPRRPGAAGLVQRHRRHDRPAYRPLRPAVPGVGRTGRETFAAIKLRRVDPIACLKHLEGALSVEPDELAASPRRWTSTGRRTGTSPRSSTCSPRSTSGPTWSRCTDAAWEQLLADLFG